ncbi:MAG: hypothetical protein QW728_07095, partial [Thermoplasmata archaeon]
MARAEETYISQGDMARAAPFVSAFLLVIALFLSTSSEPLFIGGWIGCCLLAVILFPIGFPHTWRYAIWMGGMYIVFTLGTVLVYYFIMNNMWGLVLLPVFLLAGVIVTWMLFEKVRMDRFLQYRLFRGTGVTVRQAPIGIWFISLILFDIFSILSGVGIGRWMFSEAFFGMPFMYILSELVLILIAYYIL